MKSNLTVKYFYYDTQETNKFEFQGNPNEWPLYFKAIVTILIISSFWGCATTNFPTTPIITGPGFTLGGEPATIAYQDNQTGKITAELVSGAVMAPDGVWTVIDSKPSYFSGEYIIRISKGGNLPNTTTYKILVMSTHYGGRHEVISTLFTPGFPASAQMTAIFRVDGPPASSGLPYQLLINPTKPNITVTVSWQGIIVPIN